MSQENGLVGRMVGGMIRRSVRKRFHTVYWRSDAGQIEPPAILYANHHGWMDGYLMFHLIERLGLECVDWIEEFDAFPLFAKIGGIRFAKGDPMGRAKAIRQTIRLMREGRSLVLFPEGVLHRPPGIRAFGRALEVVAENVPGVTLVPVAIHTELSMHERPEAWLSLGEPHRFESLRSSAMRLGEQLDELRCLVSKGREFEVLAKGTPDVNERWDMRRMDKR